ncbi:MAG: type II toxin-antitoxin system prevent-host-death family antitoxin [Deltaproteobacteria bacterium]|nr:type II toxin-antitoxin system prevent-host-death family antitoxin [Deltaproteobacteria bacterium]MBW1849131.1 type II toxin-antitoxin system prevent-host-death family antitoxin [Deltaproteobacteria bacterium]
MKSIDVFTARDLRNQSGKLMRDAEQGHVSLITKHGRPKMVTIPFDKRILNHGVHYALALHLFKGGDLTLVQAAKLADMKLDSFIKYLGEAGVDAVDYSADELKRELKTAL